MADVTGPISTLPGFGHPLPDGATCDLHPDRPAIVRVQGETDSFGAELNDMCGECLESYREELRTADTSGVCDWCKNHAPRLRNRRDIDEGMYGRVYEVCDACCKRDEGRIQDELDRYDTGYDWADDD
jgi:hypothetical protein